MRNWPFPREINPYYAEVKKESDAWLRTFNFFNPKDTEAYLRCDFALASALIYPRVNKDGLRLICDMMNIYFVLDEFTDIADDDTAQELCDMVVDAFRNPFQPRPEGEHRLGEMSRHVWERVLTIGSETYNRRALSLWEDYITGVAQEARDRNAGHIRDIEDFLDLRRRTVAGFVVAAGNYPLKDISDELLDHPVMHRLEELVTDFVIYENDLFSYQKEEAASEPHNMLTTYMHAGNASIQEAIDWSGEQIDKVVKEFIELSQHHFWKDPAFDQDAHEYILGLGWMIRGHNAWCFEGERYFGKEGAKVDKSRSLVLSGVKQKVICWE